MNKTKMIFGIGIVLVVLAVLTAPAVAQEYDVFHLVPVDSSCNEAGCTTTVWVMVNVSQSDINAFQAAIIFDPSVVNVTKVERGIPAWYTWGWAIFDSGGKKFLKITGSELMGGFGPGELQLGKMTLECKAPGISALHFANQSEVGYDRTELGNAGGAVCGPTPDDCDTEDGTYTCLSPPETFSKYLEEGWNLISLPLTNTTDMKVSNIIDTSLNDKYDALYRYDASAHNFVALSSEAGDTMENGVGYFIHMTTADTWTYTGSAYIDMSVGLSTGLNMVGWLNCSETIGTGSGDALYSIKDNYYYVASWNATAQEYETYNPAAPSVFNSFTTMDRGTGYFISAKTATTLTEGC